MGALSQEAYGKPGKLRALLSDDRVDPLFRERAEVLVDAIGSSLAETGKAFADLACSLLGVIALQHPEHNAKFRHLRHQLKPPLLSADLADLEGFLAQLATDHAATQVTGGFKSSLIAAHPPSVWDEEPETYPGTQSEVVQELQELLNQHRHFGQVLEAAAHGLQQSGDADEPQLANALVSEMEVIYGLQQSLCRTLDRTCGSLHLVEAETRELSEELIEVRQLSMTDELTGLPNRRAFERRLQEEIARANRYGATVGLSMIDLDGFKRVNDQHGHAMGDSVLIAYAQQLQAVFRQQDMVARYGGEEIAILLPNTELHGILQALSKVRAAVAAESVNRTDTPIALPTFSAGVALYKPGETALDFITRADEALYKAKRDGRNRIEVSPEDQRTWDARS